MASNYVQSNQRHEIYKQDADLINGHAPVVKSIELSRRQTKPTPVQLKHPVMGKPESYEPYDQDQVVKEGAPQEEIAEWKVIHGFSRHDSQR
jgi:hypothetical protein